MNTVRNIRLVCSVTVVLFAFVASSSKARAASVLAIDFNGGGSTSTETGFSSFSAGNGVLAFTTTSQTFGAITVSLSSTGNLFARNRGAIAEGGGFTFSDLYRDWISGRDPVSGVFQPMTLSLSGLALATNYQLVFYAYDSSAVGSTTQVFTNITSGGSSGLGSITYVGSSAPVSNSQYSLTATVTSSNTGAIDISALVNAGGAQQRALLNGFELNTAAVPEPHTTWLIAIAGAILAFTGRNRRLSSDWKNT